MAKSLDESYCNEADFQTISNDNQFLMSQMYLVLLLMDGRLAVLQFLSLNAGFSVARPLQQERKLI